MCMSALPNGYSQLAGALAPKSCRIAARAARLIFADLRQLTTTTLRLGYALSLSGAHRRVLCRARQPALGRPFCGDAIASRTNRFASIGRFLSVFIHGAGPP